MTNGGTGYDATSSLATTDITDFTTEWKTIAFTAKATGSGATKVAFDGMVGWSECNCSAFIKKQREFFDVGEEAMHPMTMSQVADEIGVHETTVSRAIANKYIQPPRGLYPFRHFFSTGYTSTDGDELSSHSIKTKIVNRCKEMHNKWTKMENYLTFDDCLHRVREGQVHQGAQRLGVDHHLNQEQKRQD